MAYKNDDDVSMIFKIKFLFYESQILIREIKLTDGETKAYTTPNNISVQAFLPCMAMVSWHLIEFARYIHPYLSG